MLTDDTAQPATGRPRILVAIPTSLSVLRIVMAVIFPFSNKLLGVVLIVSAALSDRLDGFLARRWKVTSLWGRALDAATDKLFTWTVLGVLVYREAIPVGFVPLLLARDIIVVPASIAGLLGWRREQLQKLEHRMAGRLATVMLLIYLVAEVAAPAAPLVQWILGGAASVLSLIAALDYAARIIRLSQDRDT